MRRELQAKFENKIFDENVLEDFPTFLFLKLEHSPVAAIFGSQSEHSTDFRITKRSGGYGELNTNNDSRLKYHRLNNSLSYKGFQIILNLFTASCAEKGLNVGITW